VPGVVDFEPAPVAGGDHGVAVRVVAGDRQSGCGGECRFDGRGDRVMVGGHYPEPDLS
jgi:hypothetical protein